MYNTIGYGGLEGNIGDFETSDYPYYKSSSEFTNYFALVVGFISGNKSSSYKSNLSRVRVIRAF